MIRLDRDPEPEVLQQNRDKWTAEFVDYPEPRAKMPAATRYRYRHAQIKSALVARSHGKCMYCESPVTRTHPGEIEHILPSSKRPDLVVNWGNLGFVCHDCNWTKLDYYDPGLVLVDPYREDPDEHLLWVGPVVRHRPGSYRGRATITTVALDRAELFEARMERLKALEGLLDQAARLGPSERALIVREIEAELEDSKPYAAATRAYVRFADPSR